MRRIMLVLRRLPRLSALTFSACLAVLASNRAAGQTGVLRGVVVDSADGSPIENADVLLIALHQVARSNAKGQFTLIKLPKGEVELTIRRIGYEPQTETVVLSGGDRDSVKVVLAARPEVLDAVRANEAERHRRQGVEDFYVRRAQGIGTFITREQLEQLHSTQPSEALRSVPGIELRTRRDGSSSVRFTGTSTLSHRDCPPTIWLDGQRAPGLELDQIPARDIEGIELYRGAATTPAQFWQGSTSGGFCGTIVVWSRVPGT